MQLAGEGLERSARVLALAFEQRCERAPLAQELEHALAIGRELRELRGIGVVGEHALARTNRLERALGLRDGAGDVASGQEIGLDRARERMREQRARLPVAERELDQRQIARRGEIRLRTQLRAPLDALATTRDELVGAHVTREMQEVMTLLHEVEDVVAREERQVRAQARHHLLEHLRRLLLRHA